jgi:hypothetical protein
VGRAIARSTGTLGSFWIALCFLSGAAYGQSTFLFGFAGPRELWGEEGETLDTTFECTLGQENVPPPADPLDPIHTGFGAQGWALSMICPGGSIVSIDTAGTAADTLENGGYRSNSDGFNYTQLTTESGSGPCEGSSGATSAIVLALRPPLIALPNDATYVVARIGVQATIPPGGGWMVLQYADGCQPSGRQPVDNLVSQMRESIKPTLGTTEVTLSVNSGVFRRGDANTDGTTDISDPVATLGFLFLGTEVLRCRDAADADDSGELDISDAIYSLTFQFLGGPPPKTPFHACDTDGTKDPLDCEVFSPCGRG